MSLPDATQTLVDDLRDAGAPQSMVDKALSFAYHDFRSDHAMPKHLLVDDATAAGLSEIAEKAKQGAYDDEL